LKQVGNLRYLQTGSLLSVVLQPDDQVDHYGHVYDDDPRFDPRPMLRHLVNFTRPTPSKLASTANRLSIHLSLGKAQNNGGKTRKQPGPQASSVHGFRIGRVSNALAESSFRNCSAFGSHLSLRPILMAMFDK